MISVIVCSRHDPSWEIHSSHIESTVGTDFEYIRIDNRDNSHSLCSAYNLGVRKAIGDIVVFVHEDVFFITQNWGMLLHSKFNKDKTIGLIGVAGTQYISQDNPFWPAAGRPFIHGKVIHEDKRLHKYIFTIFSESIKDIEVVAVDGLFFSVRKTLFQNIKFDEKTFDRYHFYDLDICMQVRKTHKIFVTSDILVKHLSGGSFDDTWRCYSDAFVNKYEKKLPVSCTDRKPDPANRISFESYDLEKVVSKESVKIIKHIGE